MKGKPMSYVVAILGGIVGLIILLAGLVMIGGGYSRRLARSEARGMLATVASANGDTVAGEELADLPEPVQRWLRYAGVVGKPRVRSVRLKQQGTLRQQEGKSWMPFEAEQYFTIDPPAFIWIARVTSAGLPIMGVQDIYR